MKLHTTFLCFALLASFAMNGCGPGLSTAFSELPSVSSATNAEPTSSTPASFSFSALSPRPNIVGGNSLAFSYSAEGNTSASFAIYYTPSNSGECTDDGVLITSSITLGENPEHTWNTAGVPSGFYYLCTRIEDNGIVTNRFSEPLLVYSESVCSWTGDVDSNWNTPANWLGCSSGIPDTASEWVLVSQWPANQPTLSSTIQIAGAAAGQGGGTITVPASRDLIFQNTATTIQSDLKIQGTDGCTTCDWNRPVTTTVTNGAKLTLGRNLRVLEGAHLFIGTGASSGHLSIDEGDLSMNDWPRFAASSGHANMIIQGPSLDNRSSVYFNGVRFHNVPWSTGYQQKLRFTNNYEIARFDNTEFRGLQSHYTWGMLQLENCANALFTDTQWDGFSAVHGGNVTASSCSGIPANTIRISGSGATYGPLYENDPNGVIAWTDSPTTTSFTCVWGGGNADWHDASNWTACNDRSGIPDAYDWVRIPSGNTVSLNQNTNIRGFAMGAGGGTVSFANGILLAIRDNGLSPSIRSDVTLLPVNNSCSNCGIWMYGHLIIDSGATLTASNGLRLHANNRNIYVGNGTSNGHFYALDPGGAQKVTFTKYGENASGAGKLIVEGLDATARSQLSLDAMVFDALLSNNSGLEIRKAAEIVKLDALTMAVSYHNYNMSHVAGGKYIHVQNCTDTVFSATNWTGLNFVDALDAGEYNIDFSGTACDGSATLSIVSPTGAGAGPSRELDPGTNDILWP